MREKSVTYLLEVPVLDYLPTRWVCGGLWVFVRNEERGTVVETAGEGRNTDYPQAVRPVTDRVDFVCGGRAAASNDSIFETVNAWQSGD